MSDVLIAIAVMVAIAAIMAVLMYCAIHFFVPTIIFLSLVAAGTVFATVLCAVKEIRR